MEREEAMQEYLTRTHLSEKMDHLGGTLLLLAGSLTCFVLLWGLRLSALLAGGALGVMLIVLRERGRGQRVHRREKQLRQRIGGEMKMEQWLLMLPRRAHFEAALLLQLPVERAEDWGVVCRTQTQEKAVVFCAQMHPSEKLSVRDIAAYQRICLREKAQRGILCAAGDLTQEARSQALLPPEVKIVGYARMIALAGALWPATDEQLVALGRRKHQGQIEKALLHTVLASGREQKYLLYGLLLCMLYLLSGLRAYLWPGCVCLMLMALCRTGRFAAKNREYL